MPWYWSASPSLDYKTPHKSPQVGTHSFEDISLLWTLLLSRAILFYFTQNYSCKIWFSTSHQQRGWTFGKITNNMNIQFSFLDCIFNSNYCLLKPSYCCQNVGFLHTSAKQKYRDRVLEEKERIAIFLCQARKKESISGFTFHFTVNIFLFTQCVGITQLILEFLSKGVAPCIVVVRVVYPNGRGKLGASYATILIPCTALYIPIIPK